MDREPRLLIATSVPSTLTAFLLPYARHYRAKGWRVDAVTNGGQACQPCLEAFDAVHEVPWTRTPTDRENLLASPRILRDLQRRERYDIVHAHDPIAAFVTRFAFRRVRRRSGLRVIYTAHGFHFHAGGRPVHNTVYRTLEWTAARWTDFLVVINQDDREAARRFPIPGDRVVPMPGIGVDTSVYDPDRVTDDEVRRVRTELGLREEEELLLMVAEFNPGKRHRDAVEALRRAERPWVVLAFAGEGPLTDEVRAQVRSAGLGPRVRFLGYRQDVPTLVRASIGLMLPSEREGLPRSVMEASCLERPVIASHVRGIRELVQDGGTGILHPVGDVDAIASAIRTLADDPEARVRMGRRGREAMRRFDLRNVLSMHDALYERALERG